MKIDEFTKEGSRYGKSSLLKVVVLALVSLPVSAIATSPMNPTPNLQVCDNPSSHAIHHYLRYKTIKVLYIEKNKNNLEYEKPGIRPTVSTNLTLQNEKTLPPQYPPWSSPIFTPSALLPRRFQKLLFFDFPSRFVVLHRFSPLLRILCSLDIVLFPNHHSQRS